MPDVQMNGIEFEIRSNSDAAVSSINNLSNALKRLKTATAGGLGLKSVARDMSALEKAWDNLTDKNIGQVLKGFGKGIASLAGTPIRKAISGVEGMASGVKTLFSSMKRIAFYRVIRSAIKEITKAFEEGSERAYLYAKKYGDSTKYVSNALTGLSSASFKMQNQLGAAWTTLLAQIAPIVSQIISLVTAAANAITQLFAILGGHSTYLKAIDYTRAWADETKKGGAAAKEWKNQLMKFDELNRLEDKTSGGGGGSTKPSDYNNMFTEMPVVKSIKDFVDDIKNLINNSDWKGLGTLIGKKINEIIASINWSKLGKWVGDKINALFTTTYWTLKTINFRKIGESVAQFLTGEDGIGGALRSIDFKNLGGIIAKGFTILPDIIIGAWRKLDFKLVGKSIHDTVVGFFDGLTEWVNEIDWDQFGKDIVKGFTDLFDGLQIKDIVASIGRFAASILSALNSALAPIWERLGGFFTDKINGIVDWINDTGIAKWVEEQTGWKLKRIELPVEPTLDGPSQSNAKKFVKNTDSQVRKASSSNPIDFNSTAEFREYVDKFTGRPNIPSVSKFESFRQMFSTPNINSNADFVTRTDGRLDKTFSTTADFRNRQEGNLNKTFNTTANFTNRQNNINTEFNSTANFTKTKLASSVPKDGSNLKLNATANVTKVTGKIGTTISVKQEKGGVYQGGRWLPIQNFASGGSPFGGQIFRARENGNPELVGTIRGSTAVMNNNQIVASVSSGVARAMSGIRFSLNEGNGNADLATTLYQAVVNAMNDSDKDIYLDGSVVYSKMLDRNRAETYRTGINPMTAMG